MDMSGSFSADVRNWTHRRFGSGAFDFVDRAYLVDWLVKPACSWRRAHPRTSARAFATLMWAVSWVIKGLPPFERDFDRDDPLIDHKHRDNQQVTWFSLLYVV